MAPWGKVVQLVDGLHQQYSKVRDPGVILESIFICRIDIAEVGTKRQQVGQAIEQGEGPSYIA